MKVKIEIDRSELDEVDLTAEQFQQAASSALGKLECPDNGNPIYLNSINVEVIVDYTEIAKENQVNVTMANINNNIFLKCAQG